jgi:hypothetical protein
LHGIITWVALLSDFQVNNNILSSEIIIRFTLELMNFGVLEYFKYQE